MRDAPAYEITGCPVCGATRGTEVADAEAMRRELELLWVFHTRRLRPAVPPRQLLDRVAFTQDPPLRVERCDECGLVFRNPRERVQALVDAYAGERQDDAVLGALFATQRDAARAQLARLQAVTGRAGRVLEVGSYVGGFLAAAGERGWRAEGVDVNAAVVDFARRRGLRCALGDLASWEGAPGVDAVALWNVFDQLADPRDAVRRARRLLAPGGVVVVRVPNGAFWVEWRRRLAGRAGGVARLLLAHANLLGFPYRHGFTVPTLRRLFAAQGLTVTRVFGDALVPIGDRWTRPWARVEERVVKRLQRLAARGMPERAPWVEVYARLD